MRKTLFAAGNSKDITPVLLVFLTCIIFLTNCSRQSSQNPNDYSDALIVIPSATKVHYYRKVGGIDQVTYQLKEEYPASNIISEISEKLEKNGWQPLEEDFLNPGLPSSHVRGWTDFVDGTRKPEIKVHQWLAQWKDKQVNIVAYVFLYEYTINDRPNLSTLKVYASYFPTSIVKLMLEEIKKDNIRRNKK